MFALQIINMSHVSQSLDSTNNLLQFDIYVSLKVLPDLLYTSSDLADFKLNVTKFVLEPIHVVFGESDTRAFRTVFAILRGSGMPSL